MSKHYIGEIGTELILDTGILIGSATSNYIKYKDPASITGSFASSLYSSYSVLAGATGTYLLKYTLASGNIATPGEWRFQAFIGTASGTWYGETVKINFFDNYE